MDSSDSSSEDDVTFSQKVRFVLDDGSTFKLNDHALFTQMDVLCHFSNGDMGWKEMSRWVKYEEKVEVGDRWSKPHVATVNMHAFGEVRKAFAQNTCAVSLGSSTTGSPYAIAEMVIDAIKDNTKLSDDQYRKIYDVIVRPHKHRHRKAGKSGSDESQHKKSVRRRSGYGTDISTVYYSYPSGARPTNLKPYKSNKKMMSKLPKNTQAANILVGQVDFLENTVMGFCRFDVPLMMADLTEVAVPSKFVFLILAPSKSSNIGELAEMGRAMAMMLNDKIFGELAYRATNRQQLVDGMDEFVDDLTVLPRSIWDPETRLEPPSKTMSTDKVLLRLDETVRREMKPSSGQSLAEHGMDESMMRTGRFCGGLIQDMKRRYPLYLSDIKDALHMQTVATIVFLFFACISPIVTFGGLMGQKTDGYMGTMEMLLAGAICGIIYAIFSGQPLTIVGATGPLLVFESIVYRICSENGFGFLAVRFWIGIWMTLLLLIIVVFDLSALVAYITRFTEESFSVLISIIFIYEAIDKVISIREYIPIHYGVLREPPDYDCFCNPVVTGNSSADTIFWNVSTFVNWTHEFSEDCITNLNRIVVRHDCITEELCSHFDWQLEGKACGVEHVTEAVPDVFLLSFLLFVGTFACAMSLRNFRTSQLFPSIVRNTFADFAVFLSVLLFTGLDFGFGLDTPKLNVPSEFKTTRSDRTWLVNPLDIGAWWMIPLALIPATLCTILVFLDQQITAVIVNRKEHKMQKGHGYHLDLFVLSFLIAICSILGLPWFVAATVRSITHVHSLFKQSEVRIPGERPQMLGCREQRVTALVIHILIGLSTLLTSILQFIPMPVLYGVFMYMGYTSLGGVQFVDRILALVTPAKYQPDFIYLRHVRAKRVHIFTVIQVICMILMWAIKSIPTTSLGFPLMLLALMGVRKLMDFFFTQSELFWLDHLLPEADRRKKEDENKELVQMPVAAHRLVDGNYTKDEKKDLLTEKNGSNC